ncbi:MAG: Stp1/IreP family PP2C-type Ser/Thr phosphatase [Lachnospirales bacterium]|nr:Stp1/IreP family PP2C-type Ser/Thr phosphatase [Clostridiales bacterium]
MIGFGNTDVGKLRKVNQDYVYINNEPIGSLDNLYIVADGVGGHKAGEVASEVAIDSFEQFIYETEDDEVLDLLVSALAYANEQVFNLAKTNKQYENMGTTLLATTIKNNKIFIAHVGDCRLYGIRNNKIAQMTSDHTYVMDLFKAGVISKEEAENSKESNVLTRALGTEKNVKADALFCDVFEDDIFIMCSDGLSDMLTDDEIFKLASKKSVPTQEKVENLIQEANNNGGRDNIAVIIIEK